ncbi:MAG: NADH:flavin oxidoreductase [Deltaproteobacteria bacterium]|nr:NADH:flavin oxidoreductase [Deltaproteobacteria bacterium]
MSRLFEEVKIGGMFLPNRAVRSATYENRCDEDGKVTEELIRFYRELAAGEIGLIVTGNAMVHPWGITAPNALGIYSDEHLPGLARLSEMIHDGGGHVVVQLSHGGRQSVPDLIGGREAIAPSAVYSRAMKYTPKEMTGKEIREVIEAFVTAAERAQKAGFDGVQLHCAHGYLLSSFLSPFANTRTDDYGGTTEKRTRIILEIFDRIQARCGKEFPVLVKLNSEEGLENGLDIEEAARVVKLLDGKDFAAIEISGGIYETGLSTRPKIKARENEAYFLANADRLRGETKIPLILVGGIRSLERIDEILESGVVEMVSMSRPFIREPGLIQRWQAGDLTPARCISCNLCMKKVFEGPVKCYQEEKKMNSGTVLD